MLRIAVAAAAAVLAFCAPGIASAQIVGTVTLGWEHSEYDYDDGLFGEDNEQGPFIGAAIAAPLMRGNDNWVVVGEGRIQSEKEELAFDEGDDHENVAHGAIHVAYRTDKWTVAGFYGIENDHGSDVQEVGVEGQLYLPNMTIEGSAAWGDHEGSFCCDDYDGWDANAGVTYYFNDQWSATGTIGYASWDYYFGETDMTTVRIQGEYQVPNSNYSVRAAYTRGEADDTYGDYSSDTFQVAFVVTLGADNARERDRSGAGLSGAEAFDQHWRLWESVFVD